MGSNKIKASPLRIKLLNWSRNVRDERFYFRWYTHLGFVYLKEAVKKCSEEELVELNTLRKDIKRYREEYVDGYLEKIAIITPTQTNELIMGLTQHYCSKFGCGKQLSLVEKLAGTVCTNHMNIKSFTYANGKL